MLPQLVRVIVQPETLLRLAHLSTPKRALGGRPVGNAREFIPENSIRAPLFALGGRPVGNAREFIPENSIRARLFRPGVHHTGSSSSVLPSFAGGGSGKPR
jgi:hypothetical protein